MQGQAKSQTDFRMLSSLNRKPTVRYLACSNKMNKKHDIKRFNFKFFAFISVGPIYVAKIGECLQILTTLSTTLDQVMVPHKEFCHFLSKVLTKNFSTSVVDRE